MDRNTSLGVRPNEFMSHLVKLLAVKLQANYVTLLCLNFLTYKVGKIIALTP